MDSVPSTQDVARAAFLDAQHPVLVTAQRQEGGRGRTGAAWIHAPRAVAASLAFSMPWPLDRTGPIPLLAGLAMRDALAAAGADVRVKWPNDLVDAEGDKIGGILSELADGVVVVGAGVNLFFPDAPDGMAGLFDQDPGQGMATTIARSWADHLLDAVESGPEWDRDAYRDASMLLGEVITWEGGSGSAVDIAEDGALIVAVGSERHELRSGDVRLVRRATLAPDVDHTAAGDGT